MSEKTKKKLGVVLDDDKATFRVWAPFAQSVALIGTFSDWEEIAMAKEDGGVWSATIDGVEPGQSYKYRISNGDQVFEKNDPRARQLTDSDIGLSVIADERFDWGNDESFTPPPPASQIIYELHIGTFNRPDAATNGTFYDAIKKLDYLKDLGVNMVELMPIVSMTSSNGWGYAPNHIYSVENAYGGRRGMLEFVRACHERGIGVILDVVFNHFSGNTDLWQYDGWSENKRGGIYFYNDERGDTPWGGRPDYGRSEVRDFILDNVAMWFAEYHVDGLRVDSTIYMRNSLGYNNDPAHDMGDAWSLLGEIAALAHKIKPTATIIAEDCGGNEYLTKPSAEGGCGFDSQWGLGYPHVIRTALGLKPDQTASLDGVIYELTHTFNEQAFQKVIFSDSHDTAANGSVRLNEAATPGNAESVFAREEMLLASTIIMTAPGIPMMLQGQEFMQEGSFNDWKMLEWNKAEQFAGIVLAHTHLSNLRRNIYDNTRGLLGQHIAVFHHDTTNRVLGYHRWDKGGPKDDVLVIANFSGTGFDEYIVTLPIRGTWRIRFNSSWKGYSTEFHETHEESLTTDEHGQITFSLPGYCALILSQD